VTKQPSITCPVCDMTSYNPNDVREGYCGNCNDYTSHRIDGRRPHDCRCRSCQRERKTEATNRRRAPQQRDWPRRLRIARNITALALALAGGFAAGDALGDFDDDCQPARYDD